MTGFDPGDGWRELDVIEPDSIYQLAEYDSVDGSVKRAWVREEPVSPLPTEPWTVIRVTFEVRGDGEYVLENDKWWEVGGDTWLDGDEEGITGFEVLAEPVDNEAVEEAYDRGYQQAQGRTRERVRRETAKAVLDRVRARRHDFWTLSDADCDDIAREFGVEP